MNCFYSIQLPDGGEVTFSANFTKIAANQNLKELVGEYLYYKNLSPPSDLETQEQIDDAVKYNQEKISELETKIRSYTNTGLHHSSIRAILNSIDNNDPD
jgi:N-acetylneuraminic acid mutarotase